MLRIMMTLVLMLHGLIHLLGFVVPWRLATVEGLAYTTKLLSGNLDVGESGMRMVGLLWLLAAVGFVVAGGAVFTARPWWAALTLGVTLFSLAVTILGWPDSKFGVLINLAILAYLFLSQWASYLPQPQ